MQAQPQPPTPPDLYGFLDRLKANPSIFGSWVKRYFRVNKKRKTLEYFNAEPADDDECPKAFVRLADIFAVSDFGELQFQIKTEETSFMLQASSKAEHTCWIKDLNSYIESLKDYNQALEAAESQLERVISKVH
jgi:hypothetical protein